MSGRAILGLKNTVFLVTQCTTSKTLLISSPNQQNVSDKGVNNDSIFDIVQAIFTNLMV